MLHYIVITGNIDCCLTCLFFWGVLIFYNYQRDNIATSLYLIQFYILRLSSCNLITPKQLLDGLGRMKNLRSMALKISSDVEKQQSTASEGFSEGSTRRRRFGQLLGKTIRQQPRQRLLSKWQLSALRGGGSLSPYIFTKCKSLKRTWSAVSFAAFISS